MKSKTKKILVVLAILIASLLIIMPKWYDDGLNFSADWSFHVSIIAGYREMMLNHDWLSKGVIPVVGYNLGYGTGLFYMTTPHYLAALISLFIPDNNAVYMGMEIVSWLNLLVSGIGIYLLSHKLFNNRIVGICSSIIYMSMPYHLTLIYNASSFSQVWVMAFLPFVFLGVACLLKQEKEKFLIYFTLGVVGCVYSHHLTTLVVTIICGIVITVFYGKQIFVKENLKVIILSILLIIGLCLPIIANLLYLKTHSDYRVFHPEIMRVGTEITNSYINPSCYITFSPELCGVLVDNSLGIIVIISMLLSIIFLFKAPNKKILGLILLISVICMLLISKYSPFMAITNKLVLLQDIGRISPLYVIGVSLFAPSWLIRIKLPNIINLILIIILLCFGVGNIRFFTYEDKLNSQLPQAYFRDLDISALHDQVWMISDMPNSEVGSDYSFGAQKEYMPYGYDCDLANRALNGIVILNGDAIVNMDKNQIPYLAFDVSELTSPTTIEFPRVFYPGYELINNNQKVDLMQNEHGLLQATITQNGHYELKFNGNIYYKIAKIVQFIFIITYMIILIFLFLLKWRK